MPRRSGPSPTPGWTSSRPPRRRAAACLLRLKNDWRAPGREPPVPERVRRLRAELGARGLDGLIVPLTDEHRNEYVPAPPSASPG